MDFAQYTALYEQWRSGALNSKQVKNLYGEELLSYFEAQFVTTEGNMGYEAEESQGNPLGDEPVGGPLRYTDYERVYGLWKDGWVREEHVIVRYGLAVLRLMAAQRTRGVLPPTKPCEDGEGSCLVVLPDESVFEGNQPEIQDSGEGAAPESRARLSLHEGGMGPLSLEGNEDVHEGPEGVSAEVTIDVATGAVGTVLDGDDTQGVEPWGEDDLDAPDDGVF